jgi:opacity protein-like surface antigen
MEVNKMKKSILMVFGCAILLVVLASSAYCAQGAYVGGSVGIALLNDAGVSGPDLDDMGVSMDIESKSGMAFGIALGYDFGNSMRIEGEYAYQKNDMDKLSSSYEGVGVSLGLDGETNSSTFLVNAYYDFTNLSAITPYISAGIGYSKVEAEITGLSGLEDLLEEEELEMGGSEDDTVIAFQIGAGMGFAVSETLTIDAKYRYFTTEDLDFEGVDVEHSSHNFYVGFRLGF